jgi:hypothetical protein
MAVERCWRVCWLRLRKLLQTAGISEVAGLRSPTRDPAGTRYVSAFVSPRWAALAIVVEALREYPGPSAI